MKRPKKEKKKKKKAFKSVFMLFCSLSPEKESFFSFLHIFPHLLLLHESNRSHASLVASSLWSLV